MHGMAQKTDLRAVQQYKKKGPKIPQAQTLKSSRKKSYTTVVKLRIHVCMPVRARCMMPNYDFLRPPAAFYSSSGSKNSAGGEGFVAGIAAESSVKISLWWVVPVLYGRNSY